MSKEQYQRYRIVTPEQLAEGWEEYRADCIPNVIHHEFVVVRKRADGNFVVKEPPDFKGEV